MPLQGGAGAARANTKTPSNARRWFASIEGRRLLSIPSPTLTRRDTATRSPLGWRKNLDGSPRTGNRPAPPVHALTRRARTCSPATCTSKGPGRGNNPVHRPLGKVRSPRCSKALRPSLAARQWLGAPKGGARADRAFNAHGAVVARPGLQGEVGRRAGFAQDFGADRDEGIRGVDEIDRVHHVAHTGARRRGEVAPPVRKTTKRPRNPRQRLHEAWEAMCCAGSQPALEPTPWGGL